MQLCPVHVHINNVNNILSVLHVAAIFVAFFSHLCQYLLKCMLETSNFTQIFTMDMNINNLDDIVNIHVAAILVLFTTFVSITSEIFMLQILCTHAYFIIIFLILLVNNA